MKKVLSIMLTAVLVFALLPSTQHAQPPHEGHPPGHEVALEKQLNAIAKKTYKYFEDFTDEETGLTYDIVRLDEDEEGKHTSPTNIGLYMMSVISAEEMGFVTRDEAIEKISKTISSLQEMETWNGLYYNWYFTDDASLMTDWGQFISQVDNGWLTAGLVVVAEAYEELEEDALALAEGMDYSTLYDSDENLFHGGYDAETGSLTDHHYGAFYTEPRITSYLAIGKGDVPAEHWWHMHRTFPPEWDWQSQIPQGYDVEYDGVTFFQGHYEHNDIKYVPSWGGSMFEALMPGLLVKEKELGTDALGLNNHRHVELQIAHAEEEGYPVWGFSPAAVPGDYQEFGVPAGGMEGYPEDGTVTPHASFLALEYAPMDVFDNFKELRSMGLYGPYGFYDTVNVHTGEVTEAYLALDQGMIMLSIANFNHDGLIKNYFHENEIGSNPEHLLEREEFSINE
ncbi:hypothetical protein CR205_16415 [Alteribacter lacisalsi]|uniref:Glycoamylase-like domain-containing protein n=1 Tax=Alteribacter lacisalsi TaxID=2045244 RepID=A0A2W0H469_9BACI|nr:glucoamylase family protein [Alteribacter lacisalsi]PYZ95957.1 hypothetical protein CR205_16415 [Alteribacter lacisalsi]